MYDKNNMTCAHAAEMESLDQGAGRLEESLQSCLYLATQDSVTLESAMCPGPTTILTFVPTSPAWSSRVSHVMAGRDE